MKAMQHYLLTIVLSPTVHLHGYVMTDDKRYVVAVLNQMVDVAEATEARFLPVVLQTELTGDADAVREIVSKLSDEAKTNLATAKDFHMSVFAMEADSPDDHRLMELH
jgi:hypothetical protein